MAYKKVYLKPGKEESLKRFHPWVFSGDYSALGELRTGCLVLYKFLFLFAHCVSFLSCEGYPFPFHRPPSKALCERRRALCISHRFSGVFRILSGFICNLYDTT